MGAPKTLPVDFQGWDKADNPPQTLPANFSQWDQAQPASIGVNRGEPPQGSAGYQYSTGYAGPNDVQRSSGGFIERATTAAGQSLQNPANFLPSWQDVLLPGFNATKQAYQEAKGYLQGAPAQDPAQKLGSMAPAVLTALVSHAADVIPNPVEAAPLRPTPAWRTQPQPVTEIPWRTSTPEEINANTQRISENVARRQAARQQTTAPQTARMSAETVPASEFGEPSGISNPLHGESALSDVLTKMDNPTLLKIAKSRGISVTQEQLLKPGTANPLLIKKIVSDFGPDELAEFSARTIESTRFQHTFPEMPDENWRTIALQTYFPNVKIPLAQLRRAAISIQKGAK
jgi:hypothetical protein